MPLPGEPTRDVPAGGDVPSETGTFGAPPAPAGPAPAPSAASAPAALPAPEVPSTSSGATSSPPSSTSSGSAAWRPPRSDEGRFGTIVFGLILLGLGLWFFAEITLG